MRLYFEELTRLINKIEIIDSSGVKFNIQNALYYIYEILKSYQNGNSKVFVIGNGGSSAIASHTVNDLLRNCLIPAACLNEASVITCLSNDFGYENVYAEQLKLLIDEGDLLVAISSSGESINILNAVKIAQEKNCCIITLSGFASNNSLRKIGTWNIYVPSMRYGFVELVHQILLHYLTDKISQAGDFNEYR